MKVSAAKLCNDLNHTKIAYNWEKQLLLLFCYQQFLIKSTKGWIGDMIFDGISESMDGREEVWRWLHRKYVMSQIIQKLHSTIDKRMTH